MKVRLGHVSNSSSCSFSIPSFLLTDEQKEILLSIDDGLEQEIRKMIAEKWGIEKDYEKPEFSYPRNGNFHRIYEDMLNSKKWEDLGWNITENFERKIISGSTMMDNGSLRVLMDKIGIDLTMVEFDSDNGLKKAKHPLAIKHFHQVYETWFEKNKQEYEAITDENEKQFWVDAGWLEMKKNNPYKDDIK